MLKNEEGFQLMSKGEMKHCLNFFQQIDTNKDGQIDCNELQKFIVSMGYYPTD